MQLLIIPTYVYMYTNSTICDQIWEKGPLRVKNYAKF